MHIGERLLKERLRLKLSQEEIGKIGGVTKRSQINYEQGTSLPNASYLAAIEEIGADILFIITGKRAVPSKESLKAAIFAVEKGLDSIGRIMPPDKKAELIMLACELIADESDSGKVVNLIASVA